LVDAYEAALIFLFGKFSIDCLAASVGLFSFLQMALSKFCDCDVSGVEQIFGIGIFCCGFPGS